MRMATLAAAEDLRRQDVAAGQVNRSVLRDDPVDFYRGSRLG
jgi:hypothetical protein